MTLPTDDELREMLAYEHDDYMSMVRLRDMAAGIAQGYLDRGAEIDVVAHDLARHVAELAEVDFLNLHQAIVVERQAAEIARHRAALAEIARQKTTLEIDHDDGDFEEGYDMCIATARAALEAKP